jgi:hypothetical protein
MPYKDPLRRRYSMQKSGARVRGIEFRLSYEQWLAIWTESGHLDERGRGPAKYCMARCGDRGAYEVGNVKIITLTENVAETWANLSDEARAKHKTATTISNRRPETRLPQLRSAKSEANVARLAEFNRRRSALRKTALSGSERGDPTI